MGYHRLPSLTHYWYNYQDLSVPVVANTLPRNRFAQILANLHVNDNTAKPADCKDKLYKLRQMIGKLMKITQQLYNASEHLSIDESMILFKGRSSLKQYNPMKPIKRGYKLWMRADMDGYVSKFSIYQGKCVEIATKKTPPPYFGLGEKVIFYLTEDILGKHHKVFFDNYFSSVPLAEYLLANNTLCCGTIRSLRKYLSDDLSKDKELKRGDYDHRVSNRVSPFSSGKITNRYI